WDDSAAFAANNELFSVCFIVLHCRTSASSNIEYAIFFLPIASLFNRIHHRNPFSDFLNIFSLKIQLQSSEYFALLCIVLSKRKVIFPILKRWLQRKKLILVALIR